MIHRKAESSHSRGQKQYTRFKFLKRTITQKLLVSRALDHFFLTSVLFLIWIRRKRFLDRVKVLNFTYFHEIK